MSTIEKPRAIDVRVANPPGTVDGRPPASTRAARRRLTARDLRPAALLALAIFIGGMVVVASVGNLAVQRAIVESVALGLRAALATGALVAVGVGVFMATVHDGHARESDRLRRLVRTAAGAGIVATVLAIPLHTAVITGAGFAGLADARTLRGVLGSPIGVAAALRVCGLAGIAWAVAGRRQRARWVTAGAALLTVVPFALTGHAATGDPRWLVAGSTLVHTATAGIWIGGLVGLAVVLRSRRGTRDAVGAARLVGRFSTVAGASIAMLVPTGTILGIMEIGSAQGLVSSAYGRALLVKVALVAGVVALGAYNRWRLVPAIIRTTSGAWARLGRIVRWELAGLLAVIIATGLLSRLPSPA